VLPTRCRTAGSDDARYLSRHHSLRAYPACHVDCAVVCAGTCDLAAASALCVLISKLARLKVTAGVMSAAEIFDLHGKVALVTGASSGLGARFAQVLAVGGAAVVLVWRRAERLTTLQAQIAKSGGKAITVSADVRDRQAMAGAFDAAEKA